MADLNENRQIDEIEQFLLEVIETDEYKAIEYLVYSINERMLDYFVQFVKMKNLFNVPAFLEPLVNRVSDLFYDRHIQSNNMWNYMVTNDSGGWMMFYDTIFVHRPGESAEVTKIDGKIYFLIITGYILDTFDKRYIDISEMVQGEEFAYETNQYCLTLVPGVEFKADSFIYDGKAYLYNILTKKSRLEFGDKVPGFAKIITEEACSGDILLRLDERLALPQDQLIIYSTLQFEKYRGPQFHFSDIDFEKVKTIIVHMNPATLDKLLMVIKKDYDTKQQKAFLHIEIETLPNYPTGNPDLPCITTFLHGMYFPEDDIFTHIDFTKNQYLCSDYEKKYADVSTEVPIDFYAEKKLHYKLWCIENGQYSKEIWYKLMVASLSEEYRVLLDEILA